MRTTAVLLALGLSAGMWFQSVGLVCYGIVTGTQTVCTATPDGTRITFNPDATNAGLNVGSQAGDPSSPSNGDLWYDSTANELTARINGANTALGGGSGNIQTLLDGISTTQGVILYYNGTDWVALSPGTNGQFLQTQGASANPQWATGGGGSVGDLVDFQFIRKTSDESVTSSTALQNDDHLLLAVGANETWEIEWHIAYSSGSDSVDLAFAFNVPSGATGRWGVYELASNATTVTGSVAVVSRTDLTDTGFAIAGAVNEEATALWVKMLVINSSNSGNVQFRFAQGSSSGTAITVLTNSYLKGYRIQ